VSFVREQGLTMDYVAEREKQIAEIEQLWITKTGKDLRAFDHAIMKRFETTEGRNALTFESIKKVREGLNKMENKTEKQLNG